MFVTEAGKPIRASDLPLICKCLIWLAGLPESRFHDLRHSCASFLLAKGAPMKQVSEIMGHSDMRTTAEIYVHILPAATREAVEAAGDLLKGPARKIG